MASPDYTGNPWSGCVCGSTWILLPVAFDGDELNSYGTVGFCCDCGATMMGGSLWIWKDPEPGHKYIMGVDVSRGDSEDFSTFQILDFDTREQVAEYVGKLPPDTLGLS